MRVLETFELERGLVVAVDASTNLPVGKRLKAVVRRDDGTAIRAVAFKEWLLRRDPSPTNAEAFLLRGLKRADVPVGSDIAFELSLPLGKAHSAAVANQFRGLGWTLVKEFRGKAGAEPYEYLFEWHREDEPIYPSAT